VSQLVGLTTDRTTWICPSAMSSATTPTGLSLLSSAIAPGLAVDVGAPEGEAA
jgi:hypothetical protein